MPCTWSPASPTWSPSSASRSECGTGFLRDIRQYRDQIIEALAGIVERRTEPLRFGHWEVIESLGETERGHRIPRAERRRPGRFVGAAACLPRRPVPAAERTRGGADRTRQRLRHAGQAARLTNASSAARDFFPSEDESQYILVLEDVRASALLLHLTDPQLALTMDGKLRVIRDMLRGLAHAHANRVLHRALSPATVLVTAAGGGMLTGFDYARPEDPRSNSVLDRLAEVLDPAYVAPECQNRPQAMSRASDVYAAGVIAYQVLTGELPFASSTDQHQRGSALPSGPMAAVGLPQPLIDLLRRMCAHSPETRPTAAQAVEALASAVGGASSARRAEPRADYRNLPEGYQLTRKYTVQRKIGSGTFGTVYQVYDNLADADRAVKIVDWDPNSPVARLQQEYRILLRLPPHPNVVRVESADYLDGGDVPYLVFEYLDGKDVSDLVKDRALGPADTVRLGIDVATGLAFLHANGVYHCDIKPSNLLWTDQGCKIIDFNVAVLSSSSMSRAGGSLRYVPPDISRAGPPSAAGPGRPRRVRARRDALPGADRPVSVPRWRPHSWRDRRRSASARPRAERTVGRPRGDAAARHRAAARGPVRQRRGVPRRTAGDQRGAPPTRSRVGPPAHARPRACRAERQSVRRSPAVALQPVPGQQRGHPGRGLLRHLRGDGARRAPDPRRARRRLPPGHHHRQRGRRQDRVPRAPRSGGHRARRHSPADRGPTGRTCGCLADAGCAPTTTAARTRATGPTTTSCLTSSPRSLTAQRQQTRRRA